MDGPLSDDHWTIGSAWTRRRPPGVASSDISTDRNNGSDNGVLGNADCHVKAKILAQ